MVHILGAAREEAEVPAHHAGGGQTGGGLWGRHTSQLHADICALGDGQMNLGLVYMLLYMIKTIHDHVIKIHYLMKYLIWRLCNIKLYISVPLLDKETEEIRKTHDINYVILS